MFVCYNYVEVVSFAEEDVSKSDILRDDYQPVLIGNTKEARQLAKKLFKRFGIVSYICDKSAGISTLFCLGAEFWSVSGHADSDLLCDELLYLASFDPFCIYIAVPCDETYEKSVLEQWTRLETSYIMKKPCDLVSALAGFERSLINQT